MAQFVIEDFANGLDLRRSHDTAPPGSLRVLNNCFINEGGEIEKRKAFLLHEALTTYANNVNRKGKVTGPYAAEPADDASFFFRHHHNALPSGSGWTAGGGGAAAWRLMGTRPDATVWAMKSNRTLTNFGCLMRGHSVAHFGLETHILECFFPSAPTSLDRQHLVITLSPAGEPLSESAAVSVNDNAVALMMLRDKMYVARPSRTFSFSEVNDPDDMSGTGSGSLDTRAQGRPIGGLLGLGDYYGQLVVLGTRGAQFWQVDPDPLKNQYLRTIPLAVLSGRSVISYGDGDLVYLGDDGVRSLRARDSSNIASVSDFGSPVDNAIREYLDPAVSETEVTDGVSRDNAFFYNLMPSVIHPATGQLWIAARSRLYVYSRFPQAKVAAWSTFTLPIPQPGNISTLNGQGKSRWIADACQFNNDVMYRNYADEVYIYGGLDGALYDTSEAEIITPFMDLGKPGTEKIFHGIDVACRGLWTVEFSLDPNLDPSEWLTLANLNNSTHRRSGRIGFEARGHHIALRFRCSQAVRAKIGQVTIYYDETGEK